MDTKKVYSKVEDFLKDDEFIKYVLDAAPESASRWSELWKGHAELLNIFKEARSVILDSEEKEEMTLMEKRDLKQRIFTTLNIKDESY